MALFGKRSEGGAMDVIRCDEQEYLIWKWRPSGEAGSTAKENAIRWGSSLRVKDGEVAVFVYKQKDGTAQDFIEGPFDETIKTANFPVLTGIIGLAYAGQSPFQAEVYFINLAGNIRIPFGVPFFDVADFRFNDFVLQVAARGSLIFNIRDYRAFIKLHRLVNFDLEQFKTLVRDAVVKNVKGILANVSQDHSMPAIQIERKILEINDLIAPRIASAFQDHFGVNLLRLDLDTIEIDKTTEDYAQLRRVTSDLELAMREKQGEVNMRNLDDMQRINAENKRETLQVQRTAAEEFQRLQTQSNFITAHQINRQADVLEVGAASLGQMGNVNLGSGGPGGGGGGGGFNPVGVMTGLALGGVMGNQMANMAAMAGQNIQQPQVAPPPVPQVQYNVHVNGQSTGPFTLAQLKGMAGGAQLGRASLVWKPGMTEWRAAGEVEELAPLFPVVPPAMGAQQQFHVSIAGQSQGPFDRAQLEAMVRSGQLTRETHAWSAGMPKWEPAGNVAALASLFAGVPPPAPPMGDVPPPPPGT